MLGKIVLLRGAGMTLGFDAAPFCRLAGFVIRRDDCAWNSFGMRDLTDEQPAICFHGKGRPARRVVLPSAKLKGSPIQKAVPMIHVPDVRRTMEWYRSIGFNLVRYNEEDGESTGA